MRQTNTLSFHKHYKLYAVPRQKRYGIFTLRQVFFLWLTKYIAFPCGCKGHSKFFHFVIGVKNFEASPLTAAEKCDARELSQERKKACCGHV